jgi:autotransporter-associated beta strand protein
MSGRGNISCCLIKSIGRIMLVENHKNTMKTPEVYGLSRAASFAAILSTLLAGQSAYAATYTFTPTAAGTYPWTTAGNWDVNGVPASATDAGVTLFSDTTTALANGTITVNTDPSALTLNTLTINGRGAAATAQTTASIGTAANTWTFDGTSPTVNLNGVNGSQRLAPTFLPKIALNQDITFTGNGTANSASSGAGFTFSGAISGAYKLTKSGTSTLTLGTGNTYSGKTVISGGTLAVTAGDSTGSANSLGAYPGSFQSDNLTINDGGTLFLNMSGNAFQVRRGVTLGTGTATILIKGGQNEFFFNVISGSGNLNFAATGGSSRPWFRAAMTYSGNTTNACSSGTMGFGDNASIANDGSLVNSPNLILSCSAVWQNMGPTTYAGVISGAGSNNQIGGTPTGSLLGNAAVALGNGFTAAIVTAARGTLTLTGANTYTVGTVINAGGITLSGNGTLGSDANALWIGNGVLDLGGKTITQNKGVWLTDGTLRNGTLSSSGGFTLNGASPGNGGFTVSANLAGSGALTKSGAGTATFSGVNTYTGNTTVSAGTLTLSAAAQLKFVIGATSGVNNSISGAGTVALAGDFNIDTTLTDATALTTGSWVLENVTSLTGAYDSSFRVLSGDTTWSVTGDIWTKTVGSKIYTFDETTGTLTLSIGGAPEIAVEDSGMNNIDDGGSKAFGTVVVGSTTTQTFTIKNTGSTDLTGLTYILTGSTDFSVTASPTAPVSGPSGTTTFTVQFAPTSTGLKNASIAIANNDSDENPFDINLSGTGTAPEIAVEDADANNIPDGGSKAFGTVINGSNTTQTFTIKNTGTADLTGLTYILTGSTDFSVTASPTAPVSGPSGTTTFTVQFAPTSPGLKNASIAIANNDSDENPFDINLSGTGISAFDSWATVTHGLSGGNAAFDFDNDNDGIPNGMEWILGGNPTVNDNPSILPTVTGTAAGGLTLEFNRAAASIAETTLTCEWNTDLSSTWNSIPIGIGDVAPSGINPTVDIDAPSVGKVTVNIPAGNAVGGKVFARLKATKP